MGKDKKPKLKQYDIICFEYDGKLIIGYVDFLLLLGKAIIYYCDNLEWKMAKSIYDSNIKHITKIGVMPKEWR